jgi:hypothetical protein
MSARNSSSSQIRSSWRRRGDPARQGDRRNHVYLPRGFWDRCRRTTGRCESGLCMVASRSTFTSLNGDQSSDRTLATPEPHSNAATYSLIIATSPSMPFNLARRFPAGGRRIRYNAGNVFGLAAPHRYSHGDCADAAELVARECNFHHDWPAHLICLVRALHRWPFQRFRWGHIIPSY